ncbi:MAG TPA: dinitrogenase iron-molybdenum cofactor biosynthesis protein [Desulfosporosinus sp.]|jgi:predicted Fe-Mo cluster-binding NifX family protein|nr:dinitrogenase iron-molybdenum cofactor biosynthesis protein [Desulfosporosinus sp.]
MKIAMPVDDKSMETSVCQSFGRTPYFLIYDTESKESMFIDNSAVASQGGAGIKAAQTIVDNKVSALLTPRCGENAAKVITAANIKLYKTINESIKDNIDALNDGKLSLLDDIHAGFHNHGGK